MFTKIGVKSKRMDVILPSNVYEVMDYYIKKITKIGVKSKRMDVII